jgi:hypothetical protein
MSLLAISSVLPIAFSAPPAVSRVSLRTATPRASELPDMYRLRWRDRTNDADKSISPLTAKCTGAFAGVTLCAFAGASISESLTDSSVAMLDHGASSSIPFVGATVNLVDITNAAAYALVIGADALSVAVGVVVIPFMVMAVIRERAASNMVPELAGHEICIVNEIDEFCGTSSFDSTDAYACVEVVGADGQWRWQCA